MSLAPSAHAQQLDLPRPSPFAKVIQTVVEKHIKDWVEDRKTKGEANHWWMLSHADCACDEDDQVPQRFSVMPWSADQSRNPEMRHLCGKGCAMQALERFMTQKVPAQEMAEEDALA